MARLLAIAMWCANLAWTHTIITYPGWRGDNLHTNSTFPSGQQRAYPCGGIPVTTNRTYWPITGGAVAVQPGMFTGHQTALMFINIGLGVQPENYSTQMVPMFEMQGPSNNAFPGTFCLPQVPVPDGLAPKAGDLATIQIIQLMKYGSSLYNCADIIFTDDLSKVPEVNSGNCFNSTNIRVKAVKLVDADDSSPSTTTGTNPSATRSRSSLFPTTSTSTGSTTSPTTNTNAGGRIRARLSGLMSLLLLV